MFDLEKATICAKKMKMYFSFISQDGDVQLPTDIEFGTNEYITYIFYSCLLDYGMRSKIYHSNLISTYKSHKDIFNSKFVVENYLNNELELFTIIKENIHPRYPNVALKKWITLSKFLNNNYPNNELKEKILSLNSYEKLYSFITNINGYGQKTGGLLLRLIYESGICNFTDEIANIPIDRHDIEISYLSGIVKKEKLSNDDIEKLGKLWVEAANRNDVSACDMDKYLWSIGNNLCSKKKCDKCPINLDCQKKM